MITIEKMAFRRGVAGTYAYNVDLTYRFAERSEKPVEQKLRVKFMSSIYGAPVVLVLPGGQQVHVTEWRRFGDVLDRGWIRRFYSREDAS